MGWEKSPNPLLDVNPMGKKVQRLFLVLGSKAKRIKRQETWFCTHASQHEWSGTRGLEPALMLRPQLHPSLHSKVSESFLYFKCSNSNLAGDRQETNSMSFLCSVQNSACHRVSVTSKKSRADDGHLICTIWCRIREGIKIEPFIKFIPSQLFSFWWWLFPHSFSGKRLLIQNAQRSSALQASLF